MNKEFFMINVNRNQEYNRKSVSHLIIAYNIKENKRSSFQMHTLMYDAAKIYFVNWLHAFIIVPKNALKEVFQEFVTLKGEDAFPFYRCFVECVIYECKSLWQNMLEHGDTII